MVAIVQIATVVLHTWSRHRHVGRLIIVEGGEVQHRDAQLCVCHSWIIMARREQPPLKRHLMISTFWRDGIVHVSIAALRLRHRSPPLSALGQGQVIVDVTQISCTCLTIQHEVLWSMTPPLDVTIPTASVKWSERNTCVGMESRVNAWDGCSRLY